MQRHKKYNPDAYARQKQKEKTPTSTAESCTPEPTKKKTKVTKAVIGPPPGFAPRDTEKKKSPMFPIYLGETSRPKRN